MYLDTKDTVKLSDLIYWVKQELLSNEALKDDPVPLFVIDEVTVEVNFVVSGKGKGEFNLQVVKAGTEVAEERVQKAIVRMKPIVPYERVRDSLGKEQLEHIENEAVRAVLKGRSQPEQDVPPRE